MAVIAVLHDDAETRRALVERIERLFPRARVISATTDAPFEIIDGGAGLVVLAGVAVATRISRRRARLRVVALTDEMGPDTLMKAEAAGVVATLRAPASVEGLRAVLGAIVGDGG